MTKKSLGRQQRDLAEKQSKGTVGSNVELVGVSSWDQIATLGDDCRRLLLTNNQLYDLAANEELVAHVSDHSLLAKNLRVLGSDVTTLNTELGLIQQAHAGKTGIAKDADENMDAIGVYEKYMLFMERHDAIVMPTVTHIAEQFTQAEIALRNALAAVEPRLTPEQDPGVITDVEDKSIV